MALRVCACIVYQWHVGNILSRVWCYYGRVYCYLGYQRTHPSPALCAILLKPHADGEHGKKSSFIDRFHTGFNVAFNKMLGKYRKGVENLIGHRIITGIAVVVGIVVLAFTMSTTKTGLVPNEDTGTLFVTISLPPATSQEHTQEVVNQVDEMLANNPMIQSREQIVGY